VAKSSQELLKELEELRDTFEERYGHPMGADNGARVREDDRFSPQNRFKRS
jgi:hypothetical protein